MEHETDTIYVRKIMEANLIRVAYKLREGHSAGVAKVRLSVSYLARLYVRNFVEGESEEVLAEKMIREVIEAQGGILVFIDDERVIHQVTNEPGVYVHARDIWESMKAVSPRTLQLPLRHVFFDFYLGDRHDTMDVAFRLAHDSGEKNKDTTFSVHSAADEAKGKIAKAIGKEPTVYKAPEAFTD